jgi:hypothetical protein
MVSHLLGNHFKLARDLSYLALTNVHFFPW